MAPYFVRLTALVCSVGVLLAGCIGDQAEPPITMTLDCAATIDLLDTPPDSYLPVLDAVALPGPETPHSRGRIDIESGLRFAKTGLLVRAGMASTITDGLSGKTLNIVPSATPAASAISFDVSVDPFSRRSGITASTIARRRSSGASGSAR